MAANTIPIFADAANVNAVSFTSADTTTLKTVFTAAADGSVLKRINVAHDDTAAINFDVYLSFGGTDYRISTRNCPAGAGVTASTASINLLDPLYCQAVNDDGELFLLTGWTVKVGCKATMTAAKTAYVAAIGADF